ncbi:hypothetical protein ACI5KX_00370 [Erythrobacter sp. GH1-10]|uniref:hypothetical protein n=1 Tax=Erythrobacter sp. GH1-10 TaxID=3349334 RepID=UPI0038782D67
MTFVLWIGIIGTVIALAFAANAIRNLRISPFGHVANASRIHIPMAIAFVPLLWMIVAIKSL